MEFGVDMVPQVAIRRNNNDLRRPKKTASVISADPVLD